MQEFYHFIKDPIGIHIRPAGGFIRQALQFDSEIELSCRGKSVSGKSLFGILSLEAGAGEELCIRITGKDEKEAARALFSYLSQETQSQSV